jgi:hypothetical protein
MSVEEGDDLVMGHGPWFGVGLVPLSTLHGFPHGMVIRPNAPAPLRKQAAEKSRLLVGAPFSPVSNPRDGLQVNCSQSIESIYASLGVSESDGPYFITPDALVAAGHQVIYSW